MVVTSYRYHSVPLKSFATVTIELLLTAVEFPSEAVKCVLGLCAVQEQPWWRQCTTSSFWVNPWIILWKLGQYHGCWWPGGTRSQVIRSHDIGVRVLYGRTAAMVVPMHQALFMINPCLACHKYVARSSVAMTLVWGSVCFPWEWI